MLVNGNNLHDFLSVVAKLYVMKTNILSKQTIKSDGFLRLINRAFLADHRIYIIYLCVYSCFLIYKWYSIYIECVSVFWQLNEVWLIAVGENALRILLANRVRRLIFLSPALEISANKARISCMLCGNS